jgi:hypothetical protein
VGVDLYLHHALLISVLDEGEWFDSRPDRFTLGVRAPRYPLDRRLGGPQNRSGCGGGDKKYLCPYRELNPGRPTRNVVSILAEAAKRQSCSHAVKTNWGTGDITARVLNLRNKWSAVSFTPRPFYPWGKGSRYPLYRRRVGPRVCLGAVAKRKSPYLCRESNPGHTARSLVTHYTD